MNLADRPRICSNRNPTPKNLGTFVRIPQNVVGNFCSGYVAACHLLICPNVYHERTTSKYWPRSLLGTYLAPWNRDPHLGLRKLLRDRIMYVRTYVRTYVRILEKMINHFLRNPYKRSKILWNGIMIRTNPGTIG